MKDRIKELRKALNLSQAEFSDIISYSRCYTAELENGRKRVNDRIVSLICERFNVSEAWLRDGSGDMFAPKIQTESLSEREIAEKYLISRVQSLPDDLRKEVLNFCAKLLAAETSSAAPPKNQPLQQAESQNLRKSG